MTTSNDGVPIVTNQDLSDNAQNLAAAGQALDNTVNSETYPTFATNADAGNLHSRAMNVLLTYADWKGLTAWNSIGQPLYNADFNPGIASALGITPSGWYPLYAELLAAIAYSAAPNSSPFGTLAAASYFSDADTLGLAVTIGGPSSNFSSAAVQNDLAEILVQFAGDEAWAAGQNGGSNVATAGIGCFTANDDNLTINLNPSLWVTTFQNGGSILGAQDLANDEFNQQI